MITNFIDSNFIKQSEEEQKVEKAIENSMIKTSCKDCIFSIWNNTIQTGCIQNRLNKFQKEKIIDSDNNKEYYLLQGTCNYCRNNEWKEKLQENNKDIIKQLKLETCAKIDCIFINTESTISKIEEQIQRHLQNLNYNETKPCSVTFSSLIPINFQWYAQTVQKYATQYKMRYNVVNPILNQNLYPVLDMCVTRGKANYYLIHYLNTQQNLDNCIDKIDYELNTKLTRFLMIKPYKYDHYTNDVDGLCVQRFLHKLINGNFNDSIIDQIEFLNKEQKENMVLNWTNLVQ